jgi:hypothetical protein
MATPDHHGRTALVGETQDGLRDSQLYAVVLDRFGAVEDVIPAGAVDSAAALPVAVRLPDAQGWMVAAHGSEIAFRTTADKAWQPVGANAALLPNLATQVRLTRSVGEPVTVDLGS